jgi:hypothetical protein
MYHSGMKVVMFGKTVEIPDTVPKDPENYPEFIELKKLVEEEFFVLFDRRIDIHNWGYILHRGFAHIIS